MAALQSRKSRAIITGAAQGLGRAIALRMAETTSELALWDIREEGLRECAEECSAKGAHAIFRRVDVSDEGQVIEALTGYVAKCGEPTILVNNAGIFPRAPATEIPLALWNQVLAVNLGGTFLCSRACAKLMLASNGGSIVNLASGRAFAGAVHGAHYAASKAAIVALTKSIALEWAPKIRVNCVVPGLSDTAQPRDGMTEEQIYAAAADIPLKRIGRPEDTAALVAFLVSEDAAYITGQSIAINGGAIMLP